ncbi:MAG: CoA transferase [Acidobacteriota bacterium]
MPGPLDGIRIIDLTAVVSGPLATLQLADQGADVIKVEPTVVGDLTRPMGTQRNETSAIFASLNRNKRSLAIDLRQSAGRELLLDLAGTADVFIQNFRAGAIDRMGLGEAAVRERRPDVVYVSIAGFGHSGPFSGRGVYDPLIQAASGMAHAQGQAPGGSGDPRLVRSIVCDKVTALTASQAITAALFARERGAGGQHVRLSMLDAAIAFHWSDMMWRQTFLGEDVTVTPDLADSFYLTRTLDGWVICVDGTDAAFGLFCDAVERPDLKEDPRFATLLDRMMRPGEFRAEVEGILGNYESDALCALLDEAGVPCAKVNSLDDLLTDPQVEHNGLLQEVDHPMGGRMRVPGSPVHFEQTPTRMHWQSPRLGEHTGELLDELGRAADYEELKKSGVLL